MSFDPAKVAAAVESGLNVVCATCEKYWEGRDRGLPDGRCMAVDGCGSPIAGDDFHEYKGPMTQFDQFCFVCGNQATHAVRVTGLVRVIGVCRDHTGHMSKYKPEGKRAPNVVIISKDGESQIREDDPPPQPVLRFSG